MNRPSFRVPLWTALALLAIVRGAHATPDRWQRYAPVLMRSDSLLGSGDVMGSLSVLDSLLAAAVRGENGDLRVVAAISRARVLNRLGRASESESELRRLLPEVRAQHDTTGMCRALRFLAGVEFLRGRVAGARTGYERCLALARQGHRLSEAGWALTWLGNTEFNAEHYRLAVTQHRRSMAAFDSAGDRRGRLFARTGLARAEQVLGRTSEARRQHVLALAEARRLGDRVLEAETLSNLGSLEYSSGDPGEAAVRFRAAMEVYRRAGWRARVVWASHALSDVYVSLGRYDEADSTLMEALRESDLIQDLVTRSQVLNELGDLRRQQGRPAEAIAFGRRAVSASDSIPALTALDFTLDLVGTLESSQQLEQALALIDSQIARLSPRLDPASLRELAARRARVLRRLGRAREALEPLRDAARNWQEIPRGLDAARRLQNLAELGRCYRDLGESDSARVWFTRIAGRWEAWRSTTNDPTWREAYDEFARRFSGDYAAALLEPRAGVTDEARARAAFDALQRFRARTLAERVYDPAAAPQPSLQVIDALALQRQVLRPGEVFMDIHVLPETTFVFAVTREAIRAYGTRRAGSLVPRLERMRSLLATPGADGPAFAAGAMTSIGAELLGPAADLIVPSKRVMVAGGTVARDALDQLVLPGEREALVLAREVTWIPSASLLAAARATRSGHAPRTLLAVTQSRPWQGVALPGARREADWLAGRFASIDVMADGAIVSAAGVVARLPDYQILHVAGHTRSGGLRPWQDAIRVGTAEGEGAWLTAASIARLRLSTRICVLAGCATVGGAGGGETLEGLATAWLAAGARAVVATQWAVDDEAEFELMRRFYTRLARGQTAGAALRGAQLEMRAASRWASPYYWAGVILLGEPDTRATLVLRNPRAAH